MFKCLTLVAVVLDVWSCKFNLKVNSLGLDNWRPHTHSHFPEYTC